MKQGKVGGYICYFLMPDHDHILCQNCLSSLDVHVLINCYSLQSIMYFWFITILYYSCTKSKTLIILSEGVYLNQCPLHLIFLRIGLHQFTPTRPGRLVRTHTGAMLQVRGKGSLSSNQLYAPGVSYVPGLAENIISVTQFTDSGFSVAFGPHGCSVTRIRDEKDRSCEGLRVISA